MSVWRSKRIEEFLTLEEWERRCGTDRCVDDISPVEPQYMFCVDYNVILEFFSFTKDPSDRRPLITPSFKIPLSDIFSTSVDEVEYPEENLLRLHHAGPGLKYPQASLPPMNLNREEGSNRRRIDYLRNEFLLLNYLKANSKIWREGTKVQYRFKDSYTKTHSLGGLSKMVMMGTTDSMNDLCLSLNRINASRRKIKFQKIQKAEELKGDNADYFIALPYNLFKGPFDETKEWLQKAFIQLSLLDPESSCQVIALGESKHVHHVHLEWTTYGPRYPWNEHPRIPTNRNWVQTFTEDNPEAPVPFWIQDNLSENAAADNVDPGYAVLVTVAIYPKEIVYSIPAGKREFHETSLECLLRETYEETFLTLSPAHGFEGVYSASIGERGVEESLPCSCQELYHFRPNEGTDTFLFYYGDPAAASPADLVSPPPPPADLELPALSELPVSPSPSVP
jgi:8-oxo-dGTP pyrophosphatase MutT (NUDIX family)